MDPGEHGVLSISSHPSRTPQLVYCQGFLLYFVYQSKYSARFNSPRTFEQHGSYISHRSGFQPCILRNKRTETQNTGGSGFVATHVLNILLEHGHSVVTSVRSQEKAAEIQRSHPGITKEKLDFVIVEELATEGAFDEVIKSDPPFDVVIHTSSPYHFNISDIKKDLLDPAVIGTTGILKAITQNAPTVKRVV